MIFFIIAALIIGIIVGTITGLLPGIHINLVASLLVSSFAILEKIEALPLAVFISSLAITHTLIDFIPSIYLGAPNDETFLSVLPGHELLKEGNGQEAIITTLLGSICALIILIILTPIFIYIIPVIQQKILFAIPFILIFISLYMILREERFITALTVFVLAGFLGYAVLNISLKEPLLPLLTGLFGASGLIISVKDKAKIAEQKKFKIKEIKITKKEIRNALLGVFIAGSICSFLPALGSGYASLISSELFEQSRRGFLFLVGAMNSLVMGASFILIYSLGKARTGAAAAVSTLLKEITLSNLAIILASLIIAGIVAFFIGILLSKTFSKLINKVNYNYLSLIILGILVLVTVIFSNWKGVIVLTTATCLGTFAIKSNVKRTHLMGCLIIPTILYYL